MKKYFFVLLFILARQAFAKTPSVAFLYSDYTLLHKPNPIFYKWEIDGSLLVLKTLQIPYKVIHDRHFSLLSLKSIKLLILPNTQDMSPKEVQTIFNFTKQGGKILAFGFSSYRDESDEPVGTQNNFQLSALFGADYLRYSPYPPEAGAILLSHGEKIFLGRNQAIQISPHSGTHILARWLNDDGKTQSFPGKLDAAIIENHAQNCIYVGENLLAPENAQNPDVVKLVGTLINYLVPQTAHIPSHFAKTFPILPKLGALPSIGASVKRFIRVALPYPPEKGIVLSHFPFFVFKGKTRLGMWRQISFQSTPSGFQIDGKTGNSFSFVPQNQSYPLKIILYHGSNFPLAPYHFLAFRGRVVFKVIDHQKMLVNELPLEAYVAGVVSHEVPFYFHMEALKAMAVVARTFAIKETSEKKFKGYDICATVACQAYDGLAYESSRSRKAVLQTKGVVVVYKGELADLPYHATCGGITEAIQDAWNLKPVPYLVSVFDGPHLIKENLRTDAGVKEFLLHPPNSYCKSSSRFRWKETYSAKELQKLFQQSLPILLKHSVHFKKLLGLRVVKRSKSGRVMVLKIITSSGNFFVKKDAIRWLFSGGKLGLGGLQSTLFVILPVLDKHGHWVKVTFLGGGWGHGVGLCQWGTEGMAKQGFSYKAILSHYFPGTECKVEKGI
jgi:SpoIID/LytB domain protein